MTIPNSELSLWQGSPLSLAIPKEIVATAFAQPRFFIPTNVLISQYGIVGMLIADNKPESRKVSYSESEWIGVSASEEQFHTNGDPVRKAHYANTENGASFIRAFALPANVREVFARDKFLGEPMIDKCIDDETVPEEFDELELGQSERPASEACDLITAVASAGWQAAGITEIGAFEKHYLRARISFHGWFAFQQAVDIAQTGIISALRNFDEFLGHLDPSKRPVKMLELE